MSVVERRDAAGMKKTYELATCRMRIINTWWRQLHDVIYDDTEQYRCGRLASPRLHSQYTQFDDKPRSSFPDISTTARTALSRARNSADLTGQQTPGEIRLGAWGPSHSPLY